MLGGSRAGLAIIRKSKEPQIVPIRILLIRLMTYNLAKFGTLMHYFLILAY
jgi:E3 ubiquitin-protein ligase DOA10